MEYELDIMNIVVYIGRGETSSIDLGRSDEPFELCDCFIVFLRVNFA
jgi:hypothetical protein